MVIYTLKFNLENELIYRNTFSLKGLRPLTSDQGLGLAWSVIFQGPFFLKSSYLCWLVYGVTGKAFYILYHELEKEEAIC